MGKVENIDMREDLYDRSMEVGRVYHIYNRGVAKMNLFLDDQDFTRFLDVLSFYLDDDRPVKFSTAKLLKDSLPQRTTPPTHPLAESLAYVLMTNHFHLILREVELKGIGRLMARVLNSYTRYFNTRYHRVGTTFQGIFRFVPVLSDEQLLHLTRYLHLNPYVAGMIDRPEAYRWSSYPDYLANRPSRLCNPSLALALAGSPERYRAFVHDFEGYALTVAQLKSHLIDELEG